MESTTRKTTDSCRNPDDPDRCAMCQTCREPCQIHEGDKPCGEIQTLQIIKEFRDMYEKKLQQIESTGGGDCAQAKINLQQDWIRDLTEQNEMLVKAVEDLEQEATERVRLLEQKLNKTATAEMEVMRKYSQVELAFNISNALQRTAYLESDIKNLLEFIRRVRDENSWNTDGLEFYELTCTDILGCCKAVEQQKENEEMRFETEEERKYMPLTNSERKVQSSDDSKDKKIAELQEQLKKLEKYGDLHSICEKLDEHENLKKSMLEMRDALTAEVAEKHDTILSLKHDILRLEEQCRQTNKHAQFKDDIIKELRREIKQLKQQTERKNIGCLTAEIQQKYEALEDENQKLKLDLAAIKNDLAGAKKEAEKIYKEKESYEKMHNDSLKVVEGMTAEISKEKEELAKKHQESLLVIEALKTENEKHKEAVERTRRNSKSAIENLERAMMQDVSDSRRQQSSSLEKIGTLQLQMDKLKDELRTAGHRIASLTDENKKLNQTIEQLRGELLEKQRKPSSASVGTNPRKRKVENGGTSPDSPGNRDEGVQFESEPSSQKKIIELEEKLASVNSSLKLIQNKDEVIKVQKDTLNIVQIELQALRNRESAIEQERNKRNQEIANLKQTINELENALKNCRNRGDNLQNAVDLYLKSIKILEDAESKAQTEIQQQRITISNLQEALIVAKHELEELKQRNSQEQLQHFFIADVLFVNLLYLEDKYSIQSLQLHHLNQIIHNLRDDVLDVEVEKIDSLKDISMLESRLLKYQCHVSLTEACVCPLKVELKKLKLEKLQYEKVIQYLKEEMQMLSEQLANLQNILSASNTNTMEENAHLAQTIGELQAINNQLQAEITQQAKLNEKNAAHIVDVQKMLEVKDREAQQLQKILAEKDASLEASITQATEQQKVIEQLQENLQHYEHMAGDGAKHCICKGNVEEMKTKLLEMKSVVQAKTTEVAQLREKFTEQSAILNAATNEFETNKQRMQQEINELQKTVHSLNEKIQTLQKCGRKSTEQEDAAVKEAQSKQSVMCKQVKRLEEEIASYQKQLAIKDEQLALAKATIQQLRSQGNTQEEVMTLRDEVNKLLQAQAHLKSENEKLKAQVTRLKATVTSYQEQNHTISEQLEQCLLELQALQSDKDGVEQKNEQLLVELQSMQNAFTNLSRECFVKTKELHDTKSSKNQVCVESRNIIENVRSWLQEQKKLNDRLNEKMKEKNMIIQRLKVQNEHIIKKLTYYEKSFEPQVVPSKLQQLNNEACTPSTDDTSRWNTSSRGTTSVAISTTESVSSSVQEWYTYSDAEDEADFASDLWVRRVESMTEDLQRSNAYWQNNMIASDYIVRRDQ